MNFEKYDDLFSFNRCLMEDDYNDGQFLTLKDKRKAGKQELATTVKVSEAKDGKHKLVLEEKLKFALEEFGGLSGEFKLKNNGSCTVEKRFDFIRRYNGLQNTNLYLQAESANGGFKPMNFGVEHNDASLRSKATVSTDRAQPNLQFNATYRSCANTTLGAMLQGSLLDIHNNSTVGLGYASFFKETGLQWGASFSASVVKQVLANQKYAFFFLHTAGANTVGSKIDYNHADKKWAAQLGLQLKQEDHTWKARIHDSGLLRLALQWQLHSVAKATLNTSVQLRDVPAGSINSLPLNLTLEVKY